MNNCFDYSRIAHWTAEAKAGVEEVVVIKHLSGFSPKISNKRHIKGKGGLDLSFVTNVRSLFIGFANTLNTMDVI